MSNKFIYSFSLAALMILLLSANGIAASGNTTSNVTGERASADLNGDAALSLLQLQSEIQGKLSDYDALAERAAVQLSGTGLDGEKTREVLRGLADSGFNEATIISPQALIVAAEPSAYQDWVGANISDPGWAEFLKSKSPYQTSVFPAVEGYDAVALIHPIFSQAGEFSGALSALIKPGEFMKGIIDPKLSGTPFTAWIMQKDGLIVYDADPSQEGLMLFQDPIYQPYPSLLEIGQKMVENRSGKGSYYFLNKEHNQNVTKDIYWTTVGLHGFEFRLALIHIVS
ncbi:MAG: hypothetical protein EHM14_07370 [Methanothrix sp.]|nr:MAG: hypothetical protein EHM14_07370 [Methanothrix sp.]